MDQLNSQARGLRLLSSPPSPDSRRERRFSDTDRDSSGLADYGDEANPFASQRSDNVLARTNDTIGPHLSSEQHQCAAAVCAVTKFFSISELLDMVLCYLDPINVMNLRRTSRIWVSTVDDSPYLRLYLFFRPQFLRPASDFRLLESKIPGLEIEKGEPVSLGQWILVSMTPSAARTILPSGRSLRRPRARSIYEGLRGGLGSRSQQEYDSRTERGVFEGPNTVPYEALHVCQPPVLGMQAFTESKTAEEARENGSEEVAVPSARAKLSCEAGITLDFLADTALALIGPITGEDGEVGKVVFKAIISFCEPAQKAQRRRLNRSVIRIG